MLSENQTVPLDQIDGLAQIDNALSQIERPVLMERSVKAIGGVLRTERFLVSFPRQALDPGPSLHLRKICQSLGAPKSGFAHLDPLQSRAISVHLGVEPEGKDLLFKCYLEFAPATTPQPDLVFLALKWRATGPETASVLTRYWTRDQMDSEQQFKLLDKIVADGPVRSLTKTLMTTNPDGDGLRLLEIEEPNTPRRSLDLNISNSGLTLRDLGADLVQALGGTQEAAEYVEVNASDKIGHFAAGTARDEQPFATLYHGAHRVHGGLI